ncbi:nuclear valosin-containing protein-like [Panonychus citri]|uniref:nuclear valosin-containing protein-like n=1 Tax=Panonychus citri TaxID=50023 RepID=UPI002307947C|nr:nuclear valosin-containing protein-like [Panonychus citri]
MKEEKEESEADKEIEKALKKKARIKERYIYSPTSTFEDLGGLDHIISDIKRYLDPEQKNLLELGFSGCKRILISGVSGVGKSKLVEGIVNHCELPSLKCTFGRLFSGNPSEVESSCRNLFNFARSIHPCILIMDRLDRIVGKRVESRTDNDREIMTDTLIESIEELNKENADITIIGITNSVDNLDYGFMSAARFTKKIHIDVPDE